MSLNRDIIKYIVENRLGKEIRLKSFKHNPHKTQGSKFVFPGCEIIVYYTFTNNDYDGERMLYVSQEDYNITERNHKIDRVLTPNTSIIIKVSESIIATQSYY